MVPNFMIKETSSEALERGKDNTSLENHPYLFVKLNYYFVIVLVMNPLKMSD